ncbi:mitochondrion organization and biogenesis protein [Colletotrichum orchidophilum]|uniref:Mitochondrion organization and biogenesis protein n=1 Tax=Colletotrichum orchidophilum TaxID=1209926 RepID=A0A1G4BCS0_9PEZI|nr:mitochondrion organization and biogenesis protein [Colletotrichum orchidophilum]OHE99193.1 mitochondrion organization and biogenesis protein [Colletotrichum orchidophilum]
MLCSCRLSPLRLFIQGISQLHISEPVAAARLPQHLKNSRILQLSQASTFATSTVQNQKHDWVPFQKGGKQATSRGLVDEQDPDDAKPKRENWQLQKEALKKKFPEGWKPRKRLSPDAIAGIKALHAQFPEEYDLKTLADKFEMSPEAIRRILRSKWQASPEEEEDRQERWFRRGVNVWSRYAELGLKPPSKWRREGVTRDPSYHENRKAAIQRRKEEEATENVGERLQRKLSDTILWFSRSWTLPELIAPPRLVFYTRDWQIIGSRFDLRRQLYDITSIDPFVLEGGDLAGVSVARKMFWATNRNARWLEDIAYSLSGLFGVDMIPIYGEGNVNAFLRLQEHVAKTVRDPTLFAWRGDWAQKYSTWDDCKDLVDSGRLRDFLASSPTAFSHCGRMFPALGTVDDSGPSYRDFDDAEDSAWETSSVASFESSTTTLVGGSTSTPVRAGLGNAISFLSENGKLYPLFESAMRKPGIGSDRLRRNLTRMLRSLGLELAIEATSKEEALSAVFFRMYRLAIASGVTSRIAEKCLKPIALDQPRDSTPELFSGTQPEESRPDDVAQLEQEDDDLDHQEDEDIPEEKEGGADELDFESIRAFVLSSAAFDNMTRRLSDFVNTSFRTQAQKLVAKVLKGKDILNDQYWVDMKYKMQVILTELEESRPENVVLDIETTPKRLDTFQAWVEIWTEEDWDWWPLSPPKHALSSTEARIGWRCPKPNSFGKQPNSRGSADIVDDTAEFGQELRKTYRDLKGFWRWWFSPYNFSHCEFVRFEKFCRNGFAYRGLEVPSTLQKDYYYNPRPALREPPVSPEEFSHVFRYAAKNESVVWTSLGLPFYETVEALSDDTVGCIPQRYHYLDERSNRKEDFWGLYIRERRSALMTSAYILLCLSPFFAFCFLYLFGVISGDIQNATTPLALALTALGLFLGSMVKS